MINDESTRPTVYIVEQLPFDYSQAGAYGNIKFLAARRLAPDIPGSTWNDAVAHQLSKELRDYIPGTDYVVPTGAPGRILLVGMVLRAKGSVHNFLGWEAKSQRYLSYTVSLGVDR